MNREQTEQAASEYIDDLCDREIDYTQIDYEETSYESGRNRALLKFGEDIFMAGAEWRINSGWHDVKNELPECNRHVVNEDWFDFVANDEKDLKRILKNYQFKRWAYVDDLLPMRGGKNE